MPRLSNTAGQFKCDSKLEIAILNYFKSFKKVYMMDTVNGPSMGMSLVPGGKGNFNFAHLNQPYLIIPCLLIFYVLFCFV